MSNFGGQNPYPGYGQQPQGMGAYGQYPPQQQMHGGGMHPTGSTPPPARKGGGSKALPVMVAAGLAVGVCGGLVLVLGTGSSDAATEKKAEVDTEKEEAAEKPDPPKDLSGGDKKTDETAEKKSDEPKKVEVAVDFELSPKDASITVDGEEISGSSYTLELEEGKTKKVKIAASAPNHESTEMDYEISKNDTVKIALTKQKKKVASAKKTTTKKRTTKKKTKKKRRKGSGGLIDL